MYRISNASVELAASVNETCSLSREGFALLPNFLDRNEIDRVEALVEPALASPGISCCARPNNTLAPLRWNDEIVRIVLNSDRRMRRLRECSDAQDLKWISAYLSSKEPYSRPLWWHQDWWCWDHQASFQPAAVQIAVLCYLSDTDIGSGALRILPRSHHFSGPIHAELPRAHSGDGSNLTEDDVVFGNLSDQITLAVKRGDAVVVDYRLLHGTHENSSPMRRDCVLTTFAPSWSLLPDDLRAHLICHPAQPSDDEFRPRSGLIADLLPEFQGERRSLPLNRNPPTTFALIDEGNKVTS